MQHPWLGTGLGLVLVAGLVPLVSLSHGSQGPLGQSIPLLFLVPVLLTAALAGRGGGVVIALAAVASWDWFFISPRYQITIASLGDATALAVFLAVALLTDQLATIARTRTREALRRASSSQALYELSTTLIGRHDPAEILTLLVERARQTFHLEACAVLLAGDGDSISKTVAAAGSLSPDLRVEHNRGTAAVATWVHRHGERCGLGNLVGTPEAVRVPTGQRVEFWPLQARGRSIGVLELVRRSNALPDPAGEQLLETLVNGVAIALAQERLSREEEAARLAREADRLRSALLSSLSHDLRTPLAGIKAAASSLLQTDVRWTEEDRETFLRDIDTEADRLSRLVANLLDLSRIEAGGIVPVKEWEDPNELIARVIARFEPHTMAYTVHYDGLPAVASVRVDAVLIEQVLTNIIENAVKYSPAGASITISAAITESGNGCSELRVGVADEGAGIPAEEQENVFSAFYRAPHSARMSRGTGMGLAIVKGLVEAHGGRVLLESAVGSGSTFTIMVPVETAQGGERDPMTSQPVEAFL